MPGELPLADLRVLELASFLTGPLLGTLLADLGADVVKVEPPAGDPYRSSPSLWPIVGRNKRSLTLDLATDEAPAILHQLLDGFDVLIENLPPASLQRLQLDAKQLARRHPRLIVATVSAYGAGPYADRPGNGTLSEAFTGLTDVNREPQGRPQLPQAAGADTLAAAFGALGVVTAALARARSGHGTRVEVTGYEPLLHSLGASIAVAVQGGAAAMSWAPLRGAFETSDRAWVVVACTSPRHEREIADLCGADNDSDVDALFREWVAERSRATVVQALVDRRVPVSPANTLAEFLADEHVQYRSSVVSVTSDGSNYLVPAPTPRIGVDSRVPSLPVLGEADDELLAAHYRVAHP